MPSTTLGKTLLQLTFFAEVFEDVALRRVVGQRGGAVGGREVVVGVAVEHPHQAEGAALEGGGSPHRYAQLPRLKPDCQGEACSQTRRTFYLRAVQWLSRLFKVTLLHEKVNFRLCLI